MTAPQPRDPAAVVLACRDLAACLPFFERLGFRLDAIFPADAPRVAMMSGFGLCLRLERGATDGGGHLRLPGAGTSINAPNGARIEFAGGEHGPHGVHGPHGERGEHGEPSQPTFGPASFVATRASDTRWHEGRAGMLYRDLIPGRQGGALVASHIRIEKGGPVPDYVHFHEVAAQVIYCYAGWVRVVYEDQGEPFVVHAGDCVLQPPRIRHRVLESSDGLEVIEVSAPAEHPTCVDHDLALPTAHLRPDRDFAQQRFVWHQAKGAAWQPWQVRGWQMRDTGIAAATQNAVGVRIVRAGSAAAPTAGPTAAPTAAPAPFVHSDPHRFWCVLRGSLTLEREAVTHLLQRHDACVLPPHQAIELKASADLELLEVAIGPTPPIALLR